MDLTEGQAQSGVFDVFGLTLVTSITVHFEKPHEKQINVVTKTHGYPKLTVTIANEEITINSFRR